jgi:glycosyltransferase involved in cell wall biosynthesis
MRVVTIADFATPSGGSQAVALQSALGLATRGVSVDYLHAVDEPTDPRLAGSTVRLHGLAQQDVWDQPALKAARAGIWKGAAARGAEAVIRALPPEPTILHLHQWTRAFSPAIFSALLRSGRPLVVTLHDYFVACPNGVYYRFDREEPCGLMPLSAVCLAAPCDPRSHLHKAVRVLRTCATRLAIRGGGFDIVHVSDKGRDTIAPFLPRDVRQHRIDNPVDIARGERADAGRGSAIAYVGRLTREKGADLVAAAAKEAGMPALFIGEGPAEADIRRLNPSAELLGWRSRDDVSALLRTTARAVAAPSRWFETGPLTIYEAMALGVPAVASSRSGAAEKVRDGETGFVTEPDVASLAAVFCRLADPTLATRLGTAAYDRYWAAPLSPEAHVDALLELYRAVLDRAAKLPPR